MNKGCRSVILMEPYWVSLQMQLDEGNRQVVTRSNILYPSLSCLQAPVFHFASKNILAVEQLSLQERTRLLQCFLKLVQQIEKEMKVPPTHDVNNYELFQY